MVKMGVWRAIFVRFIFAFSSGSGRKSELAKNIVYLFHFIMFILHFCGYVVFGKPVEYSRFYLLFLWLTVEGILVVDLRVAGRG